MPRSPLAVIALLVLVVCAAVPGSARSAAQPEDRQGRERPAHRQSQPGPRNETPRNEAQAPRTAPGAPRARALATFHGDDRDDDDKAGKAPLHGSHNAGVLEGQVTGVDYRAGTITLKTADRGRVTVQMLPSTIVQAETAGFRSFTDIAKGAHLKVFASQRGDAFNAQIINLK